MTKDGTPLSRYQIGDFQRNLKNDVKNQRFGRVTDYRTGCEEQDNGQSGT